ncbi:MAG: hypothetical protein GX774_19960 [Armatimonadetes bacterium]|nr:hypothetical protein [Armatimonadota bacterium]
MRRRSAEELAQIAQFWGVRVEGAAGRPDADALAAALASPSPVRTAFDRLEPDEKEILRTMDSAAHKGWVVIAAIRRATGIPESRVAACLNALEARAIAFTEERELPADNPYWGASWAGRRLPTRVTPVLALPEETAPLFLEIISEFTGSTWAADAPSPLNRLETLPVATLVAMAGHYGVSLAGAGGSAARIASRLQPVLKEHEAMWPVIAALPPTLRAVLDAAEAAGGRLPMAQVCQQFGLNYEELHVVLQALAERGLAFDRFVRRSRVLLVPDRVLECLARHTLPSLPRARLQPVAAPEGEEVWQRDLHWSLLLLVRHLRLEGLTRTLTTGSIPKRVATRLLDQMRRPPAGRPGDEWLEQLLIYLAGVGVIDDSVQLHLADPEPDWLRQSAHAQARGLLTRWAEGHLEEWRLRSQTGPLWMDRPRLAAGRSLLLDLLRRCRPGQWLSVDSLLRTAAGLRPFFLRERDYQIRQYGYRGLKEMLTTWFEVEGRVLLTHLTGLPLELGMVALDRPLLPMAPLNGAAFRLTDWGASLLGTAPAPPSPPDARMLVVQPNFDIVALEFVPRVLDQLGQFATPVSYDQVATYRLEKRSANLAVSNGWTAERMLALLRAHARTPLPQNVEQSIQDWAGAVRRARFARVLLVEADDPSVLEDLAAAKLLKGHVRGIERRPVLLMHPDTDLRRLARELRADGFVLEPEEEE